MADAEIRNLTGTTPGNINDVDVFAVESIGDVETYKLTFAQMKLLFQPLDATLTALAAFNTNGMVCQIATDSFAGRTLTAGSSKISVTNGDGVSGNPTVDLGTVNLNDLADLTITAVASGEILKWNGSAWINNTLVEAGIASSSHTHAMDDLSDVTITAIASGELLKWNGSAFINNTLSEAGIAAAADVLLKDGSAGLTADWDAGSHKIVAEQLESDIATGTSPLIVASTTLVNNLNADTVDGIEGAEIVQRDGSVAFTGNADLGSNRITNVATPTSDSDAATKGYVDTAVEGLSPKGNARVATTANITLSGEQTIDGVLTSADRILVKDQSAASENGLYVTASGAWSRTDDMAAGSDASGAYMFVEEGTTNADTFFVCTDNEGSAVVGTNNLTFSTYGAGGGGGETNTASNVGSDGVGVFVQKTGVDFEFRHVAAASAKVTVVNNSNDIDIDLGSVAITDLSDVASKTGTGTAVVFSASPVLTTPQINDTSSDHQYVFAVNELTADRTVTLPLLTGNDEFTFNSHTQTLAALRLS